LVSEMLRLSQRASRSFSTSTRLFALTVPPKAPAPFKAPYKYTKAPARTVSTPASNEPPADDMDIDPEEYQASKTPAVRSSAVPQTSNSVPNPPALIEGLSEPGGLPDGSPTDWSKSYHGLSATPFPKEAAEILMAPIDPLDIEMKPDGLIYLPEIKYRRVLNRAFGPGAWGLAPRSETNVGPKIVSREYALVCLGRLVGIARGEQEYFDPSGIPTATEACKSNALMRCCKDLGIASELWDPRFIREFKAKYCIEVFVEHAVTKRKRKMWRRRDAKFDYPYKEG